MKKGDYLIQRGSNTIYVIAGRWNKGIVLVDTDEDSEEILIYGAAELEMLISTGQFGKLYKTDLKVDQKY